MPSPLPPSDPIDLFAKAELNDWLATQDAEARVAWALRELPAEHALSTSFGAQSAVALHMVSRQHPGIPVILVDTGYLFPETYRFADELIERLVRHYGVSVARDDLNLPLWQLLPMLNERRKQRRS